MPTVTSIWNKKIAMFSTRPEINQAVPILSQQRFQSLALEHSFHSGNSLRSIAHHFDLSADIVTALRSNFAFGLIRFENKVKMFDWLMEQTRLCDREIFGYYRKRGSGYDLLANIGWYSASPFLPERMRTFHTHPS